MKVNQRRVQRIKDATLRKPFIFYFIFVFFAYILFNIYINETYVTFPVLFIAYRTWFLTPFLLFNFLIIPSLVALTFNLSIVKFREAKLLASNGGESVGVIGMIAGILGSACPGCFAGLFPAFIGLFGISATLGNLPLLGLEIQLVSAVFLVIAIKMLTNDNVCEV